MNAFHTSTEQLAGVLKKVNPKVTVLYHYVTFTPWNATDQERGVKEIKNFGYNEVSATDVLNYVASIFARGDAKE